MSDEKNGLLSKIPWNDVLDVAEEMMDGGENQKDVLDKLANSLDDMIDFSKLGGVGKIVEAVDRQIFRAALGVVVSLAGDPERRAERRARRQKRREERRARRAERRAERLNGESEG